MSLEPEKKDFDAEMVVTVDHEFRDDQPFEVVISNEDTIRITGMAPFEMLQDQAKLRDPRMIRVSGYIADLMHRRAVDSYIANQYLLGDKLTQILLEGRVKIGLLIDSDGGDMEILKLISTGLTEMKERGGESQAFVVGHAASAGMELFMSADDRYVLDRSCLMWHFSDCNGERRKSVEILRKGGRPLPSPKQGELQELWTFFESSPCYTSKIWKEVLQNIIADDNPDGEIAFSGQQLAELQLVNKSFRRLRSLAAKFNGEFSLARSIAVKDFWILSDVINLETGKVQDWGAVDFEKMRRDKKKELPYLARRNFWRQKLSAEKS